MHSRLTLASEIKKNNNNIWLSNQVQKFPKISASCVKRRGKFKHKEIWTDILQKKKKHVVSEKYMYEDVAG